jgi:hypothetical protein
MNANRGDRDQQARRAKHRSHFAWQEHVAARADLTPAEKLIALRLALYRNVESGRCDPSLAGLANSAGVNVRTARRAIAKLEQLGLIVVERTPGGSGHRNYYHLIVPENGGSETPVSDRRTLPETGVNETKNRGERCTETGVNDAKNRGPGTPRTCEHVVSLRDTQHVNMPLDATFAAAPDGAAHVGQRSKQEVAEEAAAGTAEPGPGIRTRREAPTRPRRQFSYELWREEQLLEPNLDEDFGVDYELTAEDGTVVAVALWNGARYVVTKFRRRRRRRAKRHQPRPAS